IAPSDEQTEDDYTDLLFGPREQINNIQSQLIIDEEDSNEFDNELLDIHKKYNDSHFKDHHLIELSVDTEGLYDLVKQITFNIVQKFCTEKEHHQTLAEKIPKNYGFAKLSSMSASNPAITNDLILDLYNNKESDNAYEEDEVDRYLHEPIQKRK
ncbi:41781_t:CDS:2, partial [Gigaspora margarita]